MAEDKIVLYLTTITSNQEIRKQQQRIQSVLSSLKIPFDEVDISEDVELREKMREIVGDSKAMPPQLAKGDKYIGNYDAFDMAVEDSKLKEWLGVN